jgi:hypothetical protein
MSKKTNRKGVSLPDLIDKIEGILDVEIDSLSDTLESVAPEKRLDFISKLLPLVIKYREDNKSLSDDWI